MVDIVVDNDLNLLHQKLDYLTEQIEAQRRQQQALTEFQVEFAPILNELFKVTINELADIGGEFTLEDLIALIKRLLRNTEMLTAILERMEEVADLANEVNLLSQPMYMTIVGELDNLERKGYFKFASAGLDIIDRIVTEFNEEDVRALSGNIVTILTTVRNMTQPEVMQLANNVVERMETPVDEDISTWQLLRELRDPKVRRGMAKLLNIVKTLADEPEASNGHSN
ncbi:MAG: DUF1641 domain-containing protein [Chloroflexi bacterium]|nr:MAG: DUF1641 domain-containing protein [Chloroflexota bacterium]